MEILFWFLVGFLTGAIVLAFLQRNGLVVTPLAQGCRRCGRILAAGEDMAGKIFTSVSWAQRFGVVQTGIEDEDTLRSVNRVARTIELLREGKML